MYKRQGIFDVVEISGTGEFFRVVSGEKTLKLIRIPDKEKNLKLCRIDNKTMVKGGKIQLNLNDGKNILVDGGDFKTGDSLLIELSNVKIKKHLKRDKGSTVMIIKGQNRGKIGKIKEIEKVYGPNPNKVTVEIDNRTVSIPEKFVFVIGEKGPEIKVSE